MKLSSFIYLFIAITFLACKKDPPIEEQNPPEQPPFYTDKVTDYYPLTIGSYWVYDKYEIDTNLIERFVSIDTVFILKDTVFNNQTYYLQKGNFNNHNSSIWITDSANFIIHEDGHKLLSHDNFTDTLMKFIFTGFGSSYYIMANRDNIVQVPGGTFTQTIERDFVSFFDNPDYPYGNPRKVTNYYAKGVGMVKAQDFWASSPNILERRLVNYYIAPNNKKRIL